jgi:hypothetical protein
VTAWAKAVGAPIPSNRAAAVASLLEGQLSRRGGLPPEELDGIEPALVFEPGWLS